MNPAFPSFQLHSGVLVFGRVMAFFLLTICWMTNSLLAQHKAVHGIVVSELSGEKIPLASISWKKGGYGIVTDSVGAFTTYCRYVSDTLVISHVGYNSIYLPVEQGADLSHLILELREKKTSEVIVNRKYNRGLLWWRKIVQHKPVNNPYQYRNYSADIYKKTEMDMTNITKEGFDKIKLLKPFRFLLENMDSISENKSFLPIYMKETISKSWYSKDPAEKKEEIEGLRSSGIQNEVVLHFIEGLNQGANVYENSLILFGREFISPLGNDADAFYNFKAADTQYVNGQRLLHLLFAPKRAGENGFSGDCWIHYASWAVTAVNLEVSSTANINYVNRLSIKQEFIQTADGLWVFYRQQFVAEVAPLTKNKIAFIVRQNSIYQHVRVNQPYSLVNFAGRGEDEHTLELDSARLRTDEYWDQIRPEPLSLNEKHIYQMMDTLHAMPVFRKYSNTLNFIFEGRKKFGKIEIGPWYKWISSNSKEKIRLRFDLATTEKFSKTTYLHGYLAYGMADRQLNGGVDFKYKFPGDGGYFTRAFYVHDLDNGGTRNGGVGVSMDNMFSQLIRKPGVPQKFYQVDEYHLGFGKEWASHFSAYVYMVRSSYETFIPLPPQKSISANQQDIFNTEVGINLRYAPGEKKITTYRRDYRYKGSQPVFELNYARGIPGVFGSMYQYHKTSAQISQQVRVQRWGTIHYRVYGGKISGEALPFMLLEVHPGNDIYYYSKQNFNLMNRFEYLSDEYAGFTIEHDFEKKLINLIPFLRKMNVRQFWNLKAVWGSLSVSNKVLNCRQFSGYAMQSLNGKPYIELGTGLDNIFRYFRVDLVWRLSPPSQPPMLASPASYQKPASAFGVFGSFHIQF